MVTDLEKSPQEEWRTHQSLTSNPSLFRRRLSRLHHRLPLLRIDSGLRSLLILKPYPQPKRIMALCSHAGCKQHMPPTATLMTAQHLRFYVMPPPEWVMYQDGTTQTCAESQVFSMLDMLNRLSWSLYSTRQ